MRNIDVENHPVRKERREKERRKKDKRREVKQLRQGNSPLSSAHNKTLCIASISDEGTFIPTPKGVEKPEGKSRKKTRKTTPSQRQAKKKLRNNFSFAANLVEDGAPLGIALVAALVDTGEWAYTSNHPDADKLSVKGETRSESLRNYLHINADMDEEDLPTATAFSEGGRYINLQNIWQAAQQTEEPKRIRIRCIDKTSNRLSRMTAQELEHFSRNVNLNPAVIVEDFFEEIYDHRPF